MQSSSDWSQWWPGHPNPYAISGGSGQAFSSSHGWPAPPSSLEYRTPPAGPSWFRPEGSHSFSYPSSVEQSGPNLNYHWPGRFPSGDSYPQHGIGNPNPYVVSEHLGQTFPHSYGWPAPPPGLDHNTPAAGPSQPHPDSSHPFSNPSSGQNFHHHTPGSLPSGNSYSQYGSGSFHKGEHPLYLPVSSPGPPESSIYPPESSLLPLGSPHDHPVSDPGPLPFTGNTFHPPASDIYSLTPGSISSPPGRVSYPSLGSESGHVETDFQHYQQDPGFSQVTYPNVHQEVSFPKQTSNEGLPEIPGEQHNQFGSFASPHGPLHRFHSLPHFSLSDSTNSERWPSIFPHNMDSPPVPAISGGKICLFGKQDDASLSASSKQSLKFVLLYGTLEVWIHSATGLPNMDLFSERLRQCLTVLDPWKKPLQKAEEHITNHTRNKITSDPYASVVLKGATVARTKVISNTQDPVWEEHFTIPVAHKVAEVELVVKDNDILGAQFIGEVKIPAESVMTTEVVDCSYNLLGKDGKPCRVGAQLRVSLKFRSVEMDPLYKDGVGAKPNCTGVPNTYFPLRKGGRITLYQDADILDNSLPEIKLDGGLKFEHRRCWEEICTAILEARHLVYIAGWSIYCKTKLVRNSDRPLPEKVDNLGELLKFKSQELVRVLLLVWDDITSHSVIRNDGVMGTHDEETRRFFKHSSVQCVLSPRYADSKLSWFKQKVVGTLYTHHQKIVIVDTQGPGNKRNLSAFIGGLDLCDGRYDTPEHCLFRTLKTVHKDDYRNPTFPSTVESGGPREPWHDLHCKIEGPAAYDILTNFEQRWRKATKWRELGNNLRKVAGWHDDALGSLDRVSWILSPQKENPHGFMFNDDLLRVLNEEDSETWHVQIFRSIDSGSVKGFPKLVEEAEKQNLVCGKNIAIDMSIHTAYIKAIRSAQHFVYIENQYFLGSSFAWPKYKNAGANHLIPMELALKIASKIKAKERFAVYVVIPMWPEGVPSSQAVQEILYFQSQTMEMMYTIIAEALREAKMADKFNPIDYLNFFCLGNREIKDEDDLDPKRNLECSIQVQAQKYRRFMIYVHAKGMVVDDEFVVIGSANINQRSMDGSRDTEIAMGAYQPHHSWACKHKHPQGQVYGYRMSLWAEHMGLLEDCFMEPWSLECVRRVRTIAEANWKQFTADEVTEMKGHLLPYPIKVEDSGRVVSLPGYETFPDVGGKVLGNSTKLPDNLTT